MEQDNQPEKKKPSLRDLLKSDQAPKTPETGSEKQVPVSDGESIQTVFKVMAQIERVTDTVLNESLLALKGGFSRHQTQRAIQTLISLSNIEGGREAWEETAQVSILQDLREKIARRVIDMNQRSWDGESNAKEANRLSDLVAPFLQAGRRIEGRMSEDMGILPGSKRAGVTNNLESLVFALTQFRLSAEKKSRAKIEGETLVDIRDLNKTLQKVPSQEKVSVPQESFEKLVSKENPQNVFCDVVSQVFQTILPIEECNVWITREKELLASNAQDLGTDLESLQGIKLKEFTEIRNLEAMYKTWAKATPLQDRGKKDIGQKLADATDEELTLAVFHALIDVAPDIGKATTMNLVSKLSKDKKWMENFRENGNGAIFESSELRSYLILTEPETKLFGEAKNIDDYVSETGAISKTIELVDRAESILYGASVDSALQNRRREGIVGLARKVISGDVTPEEIKKNPTLSALHKTHLKAKGLSDAIFKEMDGREKNLALLPAALREREQISRVESSMVRLIQTFSDPNLRQTIGQLLSEENGKLKELANPTNETEERALTSTKERIATLQAMHDLGESTEEIDAQSFDRLLQIVTTEAIPRSLREHALVTLCDNKSKTGVKIKTKDILDRLENLCEIRHLAGKTRRDIGTLKEWKEKEVLPAPVDKHELAKAICGIPGEIKRMIQTELCDALKSCLQSSPWRPPGEETTKRLAGCRQKFFVIKQDDKMDPAVFKAIEDLHNTTLQLLDNVGSDVVAKLKLAEAFADSNNSLHVKENALLEAILTSKRPENAIRYMSDWYNMVGNQHTLRKETASEQEWKLDPLPLAAFRMGIRINNLTEIGNFTKAVANNPESLAEAFLQHNAHEKRQTGERWDIRVDRKIAQIDKQIQDSQKELEDWEIKIASLDNDVDEDDLTQEEKENESRLRRSSQRKIWQKTRELENLYLKKESLVESKKTAHALNGAKEVEEVLETLDVTDTSGENLVSVASAWESALSSLVKTPGKLNLPVVESPIQKTEPSVLQILEGAAVHESIKKAKTLLNEAVVTMKTFQPNLAEVDLDKTNPQEVAQEIKRAAFQTMKEVEVQLWEKGKSINLASAEIDAFLEENPELIKNRQAWVTTLRNTQKTLGSTHEFAQTLAIAPPDKTAGKGKGKGKKGKKIANEDMEEETIS